MGVDPSPICSFTFFVRSHVDFGEGGKGEGGRGEIGDGCEVCQGIDERATATATIERWE